MFDLLIQNGTLVDGSGNKSYQADLGVIGNHIAQIGQLKEGNAYKVIDAHGKLITPGFIDIHRHADAAAFRPEFGQAELSQGLTTIINGNCGLSVAPISAESAAAITSYMNPIVGDVAKEVPINSMKEYLSKVGGKAINCGMLVGSGSVRADICTFGKSVLEDIDYQHINKRIEQALAEGAFGVSVGIGYAPDCFYDVKGLCRALSPLRNTDIPFTVHMRNEGDQLIESFEEVLQVAKELHCPIEISHLKGMGKDNWGKLIPVVLNKIEQYRKESVDVRCDFYPYTAGSTQLLHIMPPDALVGGIEAWKKRLSDSSYRQELRQRFVSDVSFENIVKLASWNGILVTSAKLSKHASYIGKSLQQIGEEQDRDPLDVCCDLLVEENGEVAMIDFIASEEDIALIAKSPYSSLISDAIYPSSGQPHPRLYGAFVHFLENCVARNCYVPIETAIAKMTSKPAEALRIKNKGLLKENMDADICIFSLENLKEHGTYAQPKQLASGMDFVIVDGKIALDHGAFINMTSGKAIRR